MRGSGWAFGRTGFTQQRVHFTAESALVIVTDGITEPRRYDADEVRFGSSSGVRAHLEDYRDYDCRVLQRSGLVIGRPDRI